jgi:hypothetical protein
MVEPSLKKFTDVLIVQCNKNLPALLSGADYMPVAQKA